MDGHACRFVRGVPRRVGTRGERKEEAGARNASRRNFDIIWKLVCRHRSTDLSVPRAMKILSLIDDSGFHVSETSLPSPNRTRAAANGFLESGKSTDRFWGVVEGGDDAGDFVAPPLLRCSTPGWDLEK